VAVTVSDRINTLESVVVQADRSKLQKDYTGFTERAKRGGFGRFFTEEDISRRSAFVLTDVLRTVPGLQVVPNGGLGYTVRGRGGCTPDLFIDGLRVLDGTAQMDQLVRPPRRGRHRGLQRRRRHTATAPGRRRQRVRRGRGLDQARRPALGRVGRAGRVVRRHTPRARPRGVTARTARWRARPRPGRRSQRAGAPHARRAPRRR
jgi:hypothetical protein